MPETKKFEAKKDPAPAPVALTRRYLDDVKQPRRRSTDAEAPAPPQLYPAARYHAVHGSRTVQDEAEDALYKADGWTDTPPEAAPVTYPGWRFKVGQDPRLVKDAAEGAALGAGWYPTMAEAVAAVS